MHNWMRWFKDYYEISSEIFPLQLPFCQTLLPVHDSDAELEYLNERNNVWLPENATICAAFSFIYSITMLSHFLIFKIIFYSRCHYWMMLFEFKVTTLKLQSTNRLLLNKFKTKRDNSMAKIKVRNFFFSLVVFWVWCIIVIIPRLPSIDFGWIQCYKWAQYFHLVFRACHR